MPPTNPPDTEDPHALPAKRAKLINTPKVRCSLCWPEHCCETKDLPSADWVEFKYEREWHLWLPGINAVLRLGIAGGWRVWWTLHMLPSGIGLDVFQRNMSGHPASLGRSSEGGCGGNIRIVAEHHAMAQLRASMSSKLKNSIAAMEAELATLDSPGLRNDLWLRAVGVGRSK